MGHILLIDDECVNLKNLRMFLEYAGYKVSEAEGGAAGIQYLQKLQEPLDMILLDLVMPDVHGIDVLRFIRNHDYLRDIPVILQTGYIDNPEIEVARSTGAIDVVYKPYAMKDIIAKVEHIMSPV